MAKIGSKPPSLPKTTPSKPAPKKPTPAKPEKPGTGWSPKKPGKPVE